MKDDVNPETGFDAAVAGLLADAPNVEEFKRLYNECANSSQAPQFGSILADKNDDQAAASRAAAKFAFIHGFGLPLWIKCLLAVGSTNKAHLERAVDLANRASASSGVMQGITDASISLGNALIFFPLAKITQAIGVVYHEGFDKPVRGTGFLVAPDLFLTAAHVVASALRNGALDPNEAPNLLFKFPNNATGLGGTWPRQARLAPGGLVDISPPFGNPPELLPDDNAAANTCLDFALLKLDRPLGDEIGHVDVVSPPKPKKKQRLVLIGHPGGLDCRFDIRQVIELVEPAGRLRHTANAIPGMSGSPCADPDAKAIGLHEGAINSTTGELKYNRAILLSGIRQMMRRGGIDPLDDHQPLTHVYDPEARLSWLEYGTAFRAQGGQQWRDALAAFDPNAAAGNATDSYHPIFGRTDFQDWVDRARLPASADRVMLVTGDDGCGKSFSTTILKARLRASRDLVIPVTGEILRTADLHQIAEHIVKHGERELQLKLGGPTLRPAAATQRYDQHDALFEALRVLAGPTDQLERLLWLVLDVGRDIGWTSANDPLLKNLAVAWAARPWLRLVIVGTSFERANELEQLFTGVAVERDEPEMVQADEFKAHAEMLVAKHPGEISSKDLKKRLTALWKEIEGGSRTDAERHLRCVAAVCSILQLRNGLLQSREVAA